MSTKNTPAVQAYRRAGKIVLEIDEHRFCADAFCESQVRLLDRDAFLAFACENFFEMPHDNASGEFRATWWLRFAQALRESAADAGAGVRLTEAGADTLPVEQPPDLFPDEVTCELLGRHVKSLA